MKNAAIIESREDGRFDINIDCVVDAGIARIIRDVLETQNTRADLQPKVEIRFKWKQIPKKTETGL